MTDTLEGCARAVCQKAHGNDPDQQVGAQKAWEFDVPAVKAVIEALMEPDEDEKRRLRALGIKPLAWQAALRAVLGVSGD